MTETVTMILAMTLGGCIGYLACMKVEGVGGAPFLGRESYQDLKTKNEVAENLIIELPLEDQKSYLESLSTWRLFSRGIYQAVKKAEAKPKIAHTCENCDNARAGEDERKCRITGLLIKNFSESCKAWKEVR